jgi:hypothetical protein
MSPLPSARTAEAVDDDEIGAGFDRGRKTGRKAGESIRIEPASGDVRLGSGCEILGCEPNDLTIRQHDDAEPRIFRPAAAAELNDAHRAAPGTTQIRREAGDQAVRIVVGSVDDGSQIALGVEAHAAFLVGATQASIYSAIYIALQEAGKPKAPTNISGIPGLPLPRCAQIDAMLNETDKCDLDSNFLAADAQLLLVGPRLE